ncbi:glycosyltransferase family A protein [Mitsuaria sp. GD03876]|uniref:glycosyltransferase family 2 protein n=1 Tax=Mitsuaria sp. GD03876 TaxID=2975399 RepID=UPI00244A4997|nr:glycosyltransferase family A protein [Mitsuaria sp. GD03876]MDH0868297.1 glycosyltransferase family 2 protein [Mitsuaria sp. GD03876]
MISVVIPLYNKEHHILRAVESVLAQTHADFELVVVDDGSKDGGAALVEAVADRRVRLHRQPNAGVSAARNRGVALTSAPLIAFLDADDAWEPDFLANVRALADRHPEAVAVAMNYTVVAPGGARSLGVDPARAPAQLLDPAAYFRIGKHGSPVFSSSVAARREALLAAGGFPEGVRLGEDIDTWLRLLFQGPVVFDPRAGGMYFNDATNRALNTHAPPARYVFFDTIDRWTAAHPREVEARREAEEFKNFFRLLHAHHQIRWGDAAAGRALLRETRTETFRAEKLRLQVLSHVPRVCYDGLSRLKQALFS